MVVPADSLSVSVALCTHNGSPFVGPQVRSILAQTRLPDQFVVSDDASTDSTLDDIQAEIDDFRARNPEAEMDIVVLRNAEALGVVRNFEQAVSACTGDLIALCDQDDLWIPERLAIIAAAFARNPAVTLLHSDARLVDEAGQSLGHSLYEAIEFSRSEQAEVRAGKGLEALLRRNLVTGATAVFRRELLEHAIPFPDHWLHDEWLAMLAAILGRIDFVPGQLIDYRQHGANQVGARKPTLQDKVDKLKEPRLDRNRQLEARADALATRLGALGPVVPSRALALAQQKHRHERMRAKLPVSRIRRLLPVLWEGVTGRYSRFGRARYDMLRDLFQPDR